MFRNILFKHWWNFYENIINTKSWGNGYYEI